MSENNEQRINRKFWPPSVTSQFCVCPILFHFDTYRGCTYGCGAECCGTEFLRNHKIWGGSKRAKAFKDSGAVCSEEFGKCLVNFTRGSAHKNRTIAQVSAMYKVKKK